MLLMFEKGIRGGVATVSHRYGEANNPYMGDQYDETKPTKYLVYTDVHVYLIMCMGRQCGRLCLPTVLNG